MNVPITSVKNMFPYMEDPSHKSLVKLARCGALFGAKIAIPGHAIPLLPFT